MMTFLNPLATLIPKILFSFFAEFRVQIPSRARGSVSLGGLSIEPPLFCGGGSSQRAVWTSPPPRQLARWTTAGGYVGACVKCLGPTRSHTRTWVACFESSVSILRSNPHRPLGFLAVQQPMEVAR